MAATKGKRLVIVESPAKAKTIAKFLGTDYIVESSIGHIRDLPAERDRDPRGAQEGAWARLGVDVDERLQAALRRAREKKKIVTELKAS